MSDPWLDALNCEALEMKVLFFVRGVSGNCDNTDAFLGCLRGSQRNSIPAPPGRYLSAVIRTGVVEAKARRASSFVPTISTYESLIECSMIAAIELKAGD